ncbi:hypothetical protein CGLO_03516 [Colletotrichum gloeosporioides Cg-14]|uniref:Uncharacterized protein n=1 Tax=Colletotrichum gloeosporioides (strain Cg-14) TaxID=1237896 RepID=T0KLJ2_COLGC|nr:hypothetical protein CGLO_03516 [Colletotrichum gloeosporioides Cg-14]
MSPSHDIFDVRPIKVVSLPDHVHEEENNRDLQNQRRLTEGEHERWMHCVNMEGGKERWQNRTPESNARPHGWLVISFPKPPRPGITDVESAQYEVQDNSGLCKRLRK